MPLKLLCDENISGKIVIVLKESRFDVKRVAPHTSDKDLAAQARRERRIIVTHDSDFANILAYPPDKLFGIFRIKIDPAFNAILIPALQKIFSKFKTDKDFKGKLIIIEADKFRVWNKGEFLE